MQPLASQLQVPQPTQQWGFTHKHSTRWAAPSEKIPLVNSSSTTWSIFGRAKGTSCKKTIPVQEAAKVNDSQSPL